MPGIQDELKASVHCKNAVLMGSKCCPFYIIIYLCYGDEFMQYYSLLSGKLISNPPPRMNSRSKLSTLTWTLGGIIFVPSIFSKYSFAFVLSTVFFSLSYRPNSLILAEFNFKLIIFCNFVSSTPKATAIL